MGCTKINNVRIFCTKRHTSIQRHLLRRQEITYEVVVGEKSLTISPQTQSHRTNSHTH